MVFKNIEEFVDKSNIWNTRQHAQHPLRARGLTDGLESDLITRDKVGLGRGVIKYAAQPGPVRKWHLDTVNNFIYTNIWQI